LISQADGNSGSGSKVVAVELIFAILIPFL
jgi:hypothetical protein